MVRQSKLTRPLLVSLLLSLTASGNRQGVDGKAGAFFRQARRSGRWPAAEAVDRSPVTTARAKLSWTAFEQLHPDAVRLAYEVWPSSDDERGQGLSVVAIEGSQSRRPACDALRTAFDPDRGLAPPGNGHEPPCLGSPVDEVFRRLPIARTVHPMADANERQEATARLPPMPSGGIWLFARGYPSDAFLDSRLGHYPGYWGRRGPAAAAVPPVEAVVQSGQTEAMLPRTPPRPNCSRDAPVA